MHSYPRFAAGVALMLAVLVPGIGRGEPVTKSGQLIVVDKANFFSDDGVRKAKEEFARLHSKTGRQATVETIKELPAADAERLSNAGKDAAAVRKFWHEFAVASAKSEQARGVYILICRHPAHVQVLADREMRDKGFDSGKERELADDLVKSLRDAMSLKTEAEQVAGHDKALISLAEYLERNLPSRARDTSHASRPASGSRQAADPAEPSAGGWGIGGWICLGIAVLLGVWLIVGLFRSFAGGGGMVPGGGGYGGGGGGFFPSLLGGLFGAAAGMWLYDQFLGGHSSHSYGDYGPSGSYGDSGPSDAGAGDFSGDTGAGGDFDQDAGAGGDFDAGDAGGGGDFGDAGGDFGGDFGGGGDGGGGDF